MGNGGSSAIATATCDRNFTAVAVVSREFGATTTIAWERNLTAVSVGSRDSSGATVVA
jgi:hypothetical protein